MSSTGISEEVKPNKVYVTPDAREDALTQRVLAKLPNADVVYLEDSLDPLRPVGGEATAEEQVELFNRGKRELLLTRYKGEWLKACPGTSSHVCCNLWIVNPGEGCPLDCTYCYLQSYLRRNPTLKLYTNTDEMLEAIKLRAEKEPSRLFRVGTGELIDSLVWDDITESTSDFVPFFASMPNLILELKTKSANVGNLVRLKDQHGGNTVVSWSMNAAEVTEKDEAFTASTEERIEAAARVVEAGYRVGFHFDPLIHFDGWQEGYRDLVARIFARIKPEAVAWVSISTLRYKPDMQETMLLRFPDSKIPFGEQFLAKDRKLRYVQPLRFKMQGFVYDELKKVSENMPLYMCMESSAAWKTVTGGSPVAGSELSEVFSRKGRLPILNSSLDASEMAG